MSCCASARDAPIESLFPSQTARDLVLAPESSERRTAPSRREWGGGTLHSSVLATEKGASCRTLGLFLQLLRPSRGTYRAGLAGRGAGIIAPTPSFIYARPRWPKVPPPPPLRGSQISVKRAHQGRAHEFKGGHLKEEPRRRGVREVESATRRRGRRQEPRQRQRK
ncbi:hypothetical protein BJV78DRAFT_1158637 [Lactifluus subvellereus]|nr:hypothetical protein BJV78DRAFT_1158637 [Lactifluus subvellereus]